MLCMTDMATGYIRLAIYSDRAESSQLSASILSLALAFEKEENRKECVN